VVGSLLRRDSRGVACGSEGSSLDRTGSMLVQTPSDAGELCARVRAVLQAACCWPAWLNMGRSAGRPWQLARAGPSGGVVGGPCALLLWW